jgi:murein DD-endopeptidase MepM/ murein hydrolase activator NlpD
MAPAVARRAALGLEDPNLGVVPEEAGDAEAAAKRAQSLESYYNLQDQLAKAQTQADIDYINALFDHRKNLINSVYDLEEARANSLQKEALAHQRAVSNIFLDLQKRQIDARLEVIKAEGSVARQMADGGTSVTGATGLLQGSTGISSGPHFDVRRQDGAYISPEQARALFDPAVRGQLTTTSTYGPRRAPVPGASTFHRGVDLAGPANTPLSLAEGFSMTGAGEKGGLGFTASIRGPQGEMYDVGHLQRPAAGAGAPRQVPGSERRDELAAQQAAIAKQKEGLEITRAQAEAQRALVVETERYLEQIFGIAENQLQTGMLAKKTALLRAGATEQEIEDAMVLDKLNLKYAAGIEAANNQIAFNTRLKEENLISQEELNERNAYQNFLIKNLNEELPKATKAQLDFNEAAKEYKFTGRITALQDEIKLLLIASDAERRLAELRKDFGEAEAQKIFDLEKTKKNIEDVRDAASAMGDAFGEAFKGVITGSASVQEALAGMFRSIADSFADMVAKMIAEWLKAQMIQGFAGLFSAALPGMGAAFGTGGPSFNAGAFSGPALSSGSAFGAGGAPNLSSAFGAGSSSVGTAFSGVKLFANGGVVKGPTLGLVGEGRYNEAIVPLPDGKSIPVDLGGGASNQINSNITVNVNNGQAQSNAMGSNSSELGRKIEGAVKQVIVGELRPGGLLAR